MTALTSRALPVRVPALRRVLALVLMLSAAALAAGCGGAGSPQKALDGKYTKVSGSDPETGIFYSSKDESSQVVPDITSETQPDDSIISGASTFLRYGSDWMVVVHAPTPPATSGSAIELWTFEAGYGRYSAQVAAWDEFRGGGSGEGK